MKRIFSLLLIGCILALSLAPVASATEVPAPELIEVLELALPNGSNGHQVYRTSGAQNVSASFNLSEQNSFYYIDVLFTVPNGSTPASVWLSQSSGGAVHTQLTLVNVSGSLWRAYANTNYTAPGFFLHFSGGMGWVEFKSLRISTVPLTGTDERAQCEIQSYDYNATINYVPTDVINYRIFLGASTPELNQLTLKISCNNWRKYDYLDFYLGCDVAAISSISATLGDSVVPFTTSFVGPNGSIENHFDIAIRLDLRNINRTSTEGLFITLRGSVNLGSDNFISMEGCRGLVVASSVNPLVSWLQKIYNKVTSGFTSVGQKLDNVHEALQGNVNSGNQFKDESSALIDGLGDITASMDSVERPSLDTINLDFSSDISGASSLMGNIFTTFTSVDWMSRLFLVSITLVLVSYVLYGKD